MSLINALCVSSPEPSAMNIAGVLFTGLCVVYDQLFFLLRALAICSLFAVAAASFAVKEMEICSQNKTDSHLKCLGELDFLYLQFLI